MLDAITVAQRRGLPLEAKVRLSLVRIREWYEHWNGNVYVSFSGGKDSTVLLDLIRSEYPDVPAVFCNTGLEYPEIIHFVRSIVNLVVIRPKMNFKDVLQRHGYPVIRKAVSEAIEDIRNSPVGSVLWNYRMTGVTREGKVHKSFRLPHKYRYLLDAPFQISDKCCDEMKKKPFHIYEKTTGRKPFIGIVGGDSIGRDVRYRRYGCNAFDTRRPVSQPLGFWLEQDILGYLYTRSIPIASVYGNIETNEAGKYRTTGVNKTGCMFCPLGVQLEPAPNRFQRMAVTHPKLYDYCINELGIGVVLDYIHVVY